MPKFVSPMLANPYRGQPLEGYAKEPKWDGWRAEFCNYGSVWKLFSRQGRELTDDFPQLEALARFFGKRQVILDGELVAISREGLTHRALLHSTHRATFKSQLFPARPPATILYVIFDLLWLDRRSWLGKSYQDRRGALEELKLKGPNWDTNVSSANFEAVAKAALAFHLEGIVAKRLTSAYRPGSRTNDWLKIKHPQAA